MHLLKSYPGQSNDCGKAVGMQGLTTKFSGVA